LCLKIVRPNQRQPLSAFFTASPGGTSTSKLLQEVLSQNVSEANCRDRRVFFNLKADSYSQNAATNTSVLESYCINPEEKTTRTKPTTICYSGSNYTRRIP
jgi:hypothetical protein